MNENNLLHYLYKTQNLLPPLVKIDVKEPSLKDEGGDALLKMALGEEIIEFLVEIKSRSHPQTISQAAYQVKKYTTGTHNNTLKPMILVPFLSEKMLNFLSDENVSGIDLSGNGVINIPKRLYIFKTGNKNLHPESRPVSNPYKGKSAMVGRSFLDNRVSMDDKACFNSLNALREHIEKFGINISLAQVSKTASALEEQLILGNKGRTFFLMDQDSLINKLALNWKPEIKRRIHLRNTADLRILNEIKGLNWCVTGSSSITNHINFSQGGAQQVAVSNLEVAMDYLGGEREHIKNFAELELLETSEPGFYFSAHKDEQGVRWASLLQCYIELINGDARQQSAAKEILTQINHEYAYH